MSRRTPAAVVAANVAHARKSRGVTVSTLTDATDVPAVKLLEPHEGRPELTFGELQDVGGVLSVSPAEFFRGVRSA